MTVVLATRSADLRAEVSRLAAAAGVEPAVLDDPMEALGPWLVADVVLVGDDVADELAALAPGRRAGVHVVGIDPPEAVFRAAVTLGVESVLSLSHSTDPLASVLAEVGEPEELARVVGVVSGSGGAGATTLACALAQAGATSGPVLLADCDPLGPGLDRLLGLDEEPGIRWSGLHGTSGRLNSRALRESVPRRDHLGVLTWSTGRHALHAEAVRPALAAAARGHDLVVLDLPRRADALTRELVTRCDVVLVVCRASVTGVASASRVTEDLDISSGGGALVLRPGRISADDVEEVLGLPVLTEMEDQRGVSDALDLGVGPLTGRRGPLARAVGELVGHCL